MLCGDPNCIPFGGHLQCRSYVIYIYGWLGREPVHYTQDTRLVDVVEMRGCPRLVTLSQMNMLLAV